MAVKLLPLVLAVWLHSSSELTGDVFSDAYNTDAQVCVRPEHQLQRHHDSYTQVSSSAGISRNVLAVEILFIVLFDIDS